MRVLGIDCGTERTGYGVIETRGPERRMIAAGAIRTNPKDPLEKRLLEIGLALRRIVAEYAPDAAGVEGIFISANARSALKLAHVRGVALLTLAEASLAVAEYSPLEIKMSVVGYGRADKRQVQTMVRSLLGVAEEIESEDACDALAVAICHAERLAVAQRLGGVRA
ncbi:MAG TPA: crossover junction endodeoxyribonuclease RuvC [Bryobacteraceae bacterium]|nr:crossover junction endodeoxyribonuclease RuvC [Bryobacteraceae bacterium]